DQPTGRVELNAKSPDMARSAWTGVSTRDFTDVDIAGLDAGLTERLGWAERTVALPAGRYETLLPPTAVSHLPRFIYWAAGAEGAGGGGAGVRQARRRAPPRRAAVLPARDAVQRSARRGPAEHSVRGRARVRAGLIGLRQRAPAGPHLLDPRWLAGRPDLL